MPLGVGYVRALELADIGFSLWKVLKNGTTSLFHQLFLG